MSKASLVHFGLQVEKPTVILPAKHINDSCGIRTHAAYQWSLRPTPQTTRASCLDVLCAAQSATGVLPEQCRNKGPMEDCGMSG